jgi:hypothetical protein
MKHKKQIIWISGFVLLTAVLELQMNFLEKGIGTIIEWTNSYRPKSGPVWERTIQRISAAEKMGDMNLLEERNKEFLNNVAAFPELLPLFDTNEAVIISKDKFVSLYRKLSRMDAQYIIPPLILLKHFYDGSFRRCYMQKENDNIKMMFLREDNFIIHQKTVGSDFFEKPVTPGPIVTDTQKRFFREAQMTLTREQFFQAFSNIERDEIKRQIINDPFQLVIWGEQLLRVAILPVNDAEVIPIIFEVRTGIDHDYIQYDSRALAVYYLYKEINELEGKTIR